MCPEAANNTDVRQIKVQTLYEMLLSGQLVLPRFQRTEVWKRPKKRALIQSIRRRLPIGSLLVYKSLDPSDNGRQVLVDGLQRTIAIRDYMKEPQDFITADSLKGTETAGLVEIIQEIADENDVVAPTELQVLRCVDSWIKTAPDLEAASLSPDRFHDLAEEAFGLDSSPEQQRQMREAVYPLVTHIQSDAKIDQYPLCVR